MAPSLLKAISPNKLIPATVKVNKIRVRSDAVVKMFSRDM